jgi:hypothetical protein
MMSWEAWRPILRELGQAQMGRVRLATQIHLTFGNQLYQQVTSAGSSATNDSALRSMR